MDDEEAGLSEVTEKVKEYAELSKTIKVTQEKLKLLNKKKKELYKEVVPKLKNSNITKCNLPYGTLKVTKVKRKIAPTKTTIKDKYLTFFNTRALEPEFVNGTPEEKVTILYNFIYVENIEFKEEQSISMTYSKQFRDQFKDLKI
jgi:hypothetical protein